MLQVKAEYPVVSYLTRFLSDCYHVFDTAQTVELDRFLNKYITANTDLLRNI